MKDQIIGLVLSKVIWRALRSKLTFEQASRVKASTEAAVAQVIERSIETAVNP